MMSGTVLSTGTSMMEMTVVLELCRAPTSGMIYSTRPVFFKLPSFHFYPRHVYMAKAVSDVCYSALGTYCASDVMPRLWLIHAFFRESWVRGNCYSAAAHLWRFHTSAWWSARQSQLYSLGVLGGMCAALIIWPRAHAHRRGSRRSTPRAHGFAMSRRSTMGRIPSFWLCALHRERRRKSDAWLLCSATQDCLRCIECVRFSREPSCVQICWEARRAGIASQF